MVLQRKQFSQFLLATIVMGTGWNVIVPASRADRPPASPTSSHNYSLSPASLSVGDVTPMAADEILLAQSFPPIATPDQATIAVVGRGEASVSADQANLILTIESSGLYNSSEPTAFPPTAPAVNLQPLVAVLTDSGIPASNIEAFTSSLFYTSYPASNFLLVRLEQPTRTRISQLIETVGTAAKDNELFLSQVLVNYATHSCEAVRKQAREAAIAAANREAIAMAAAAGVQLGELLSLSDDFYATPCPDVADDLGTTISQITSYEPYRDPEVRMTTSVTAVYTMQN